MDPVEKNAMDYVERSRGIPNEDRPGDAPSAEQGGEVLGDPAPSGRSTGSLGDALHEAKDKITGND